MNLFKLFGGGNRGTLDWFWVISAGASARRMLMLAAVMVLGLMVSKQAIAQTAPAGNAHPEHEQLTGEVRSAFGIPAAKSGSTSEQKLAFAKAVDLSPIRDLAVYHNGRIKILDSLARETVTGMTGRKDFQDLVPSGGAVKKVGYDPLFTFMDLAIDPAFYFDKPLIHVNLLPLREALLDAEFGPKDGPRGVEHDRWMKLGRLTPDLISRQMDKVVRTLPLSGGLSRSANDISSAMQDFREVPRLFMLVPEADRSKPWKHLSTLDAGTSPELAKAAADLGAGWRAMDAAKVNAAIATLGKCLPALAGDAYPSTRRTVEKIYNASNAFEYGAWCYAFALVSLLVAFGTQRTNLRWLGLGFLVLGVGLHAFGFAARCYIAERFAIQNQFESMTGVSLFAAIVGLTLALWRRQLLFAAATAAVGFMILITATQTGIPGREINREAAILNTSILLKYHVTIVLLSYGLISLGFVTSIYYLVTHYFGKGSGFGGGGGAAVRGGSPLVQALGGATSPALAVAGGDAGLLQQGQGPARDEVKGASAAGGGAAEMTASELEGRVRLLGDLDRAQIVVMQLAFWTLGVGILLGAWWADHSWGRWWAFDPKELWALLTWIVYLVVVHVRVAGVRNRGLVTAWLSVLGFIVMLFCYFGVNLLLPGLHAYA